MTIAKKNGREKKERNGEKRNRREMKGEKSFADVRTHRERSES